MRFESLGSLLEIVGASAQPDVVSIFSLKFIQNFCPVCLLVPRCIWHLAKLQGMAWSLGKQCQLNRFSAVSCHFVFDIPSVPPVLACDGFLPHLNDVLAQALSKAEQLQLQRLLAGVNEKLEEYLQQKTQKPSPKGSESLATNYKVKDHQRLTTLLDAVLYPWLSNCEFETHRGG